MKRIVFRETDMVRFFKHFVIDGVLTVGYSKRKRQEAKRVKGKIKAIVGILLVIGCCVGIHRAMQMPSLDFYGTYVAKESAETPMEAVFLSISEQEQDFHLFNQQSGLFLYGTFEKLSNPYEYRMEGKHISPEEIVVKNGKFWFYGLSFEKMSDTTISVQDSLAKAKDNDKKTQAQLKWEPQKNLNELHFPGTYGYLSENGVLLEKYPYRIAAREDGSFLLYDETGAVHIEGTYTNPQSMEHILQAPQLGEQSVYLQKTGFILSVNGEDMVFVKIDDKTILPTG